MRETRMEMIHSQACLRAQRVRNGLDHVFPFVGTRTRGKKKVCERAFWIDADVGRKYSGCASCDLGRDTRPEAGQSARTHVVKFDVFLHLSMDFCNGQRLACLDVLDQAEPVA